MDQIIDITSRLGRQGLDNEPLYEFCAMCDEDNFKVRLLDRDGLVVVELTCSKCSDVQELHTEFVFEFE